MSIIVLAFQSDNTDYSFNRKVSPDKNYNVFSRRCSTFDQSQVYSGRYWLCMTFSRQSQEQGRQHCNTWLNTEQTP